MSCTADPPQVYKTTWWMGFYGAPPAKRHKGFSNNPWTRKYNLGKLKNKFKKDKNFKPVVQYTDAAGQKRWKGTAQLKETQLLGFDFHIICL